VDNRAELLIRNPPDVPWNTHFTVVGAELGSTNPTTLLGEWLWGSTALGFPGGSFTMDFQTAYLMLTQKTGTDRWSVRFERFSTRDHERPLPDFSREDGHAWTVAWMRDYNKNVRTALEYVRATGDRIAAADPKTGGTTITVEVR